MLRAHDLVVDVFYPEASDVARRQMQDFGGMVSFLAVDEDTALDVVARTRLFTLAESLGAVESLIEHPARMTHASTAGSPLEVDPRLVRLSVGIESQDDLVSDLKGALDSVLAGTPEG
jgi:cystathionine gamma-synthase